MKCERGRPLERRRRELIFLHDISKQPISSLLVVFGERRKGEEFLKFFFEIFFYEQETILEEIRNQ